MSNRAYGIKRVNRPFELEEYNPIWKELFKKYSGIVRSIIGDNLISIEHIGSTSIDGMFAKPQIDVLVVVKDIDKIKDKYDDLESKGFVPRGTEYVGVGDEYVTLDSPEGRRLASIHIFGEGAPAITEYRLFRDYLSANVSDRDLYIKTKKDLYLKYKDNYEEYDLGKGGVIKSIKDRANKWWNRNRARFDANDIV